MDQLAEGREKTSDVDVPCAPCEDFEVLDVWNFCSEKCESSFSSHVPTVTGGSVTDNVEPAHIAPEAGPVTLDLDVLLSIQNAFSWDLEEFTTVTAGNKMHHTWVSIDQDNVIGLLRSSWVNIRYDAPCTRLHSATVARLSMVYHGWLSDTFEVRISVDGSGGGNVVDKYIRTSSAWAAAIIFMDGFSNGLE